MSNIIDYLKWRGDLRFEVDPFNEIDNVILSRLSYLPFHDIYMEQKENIESIAKKMEIVPKENFCWKEDKQLIQELAKSERFKNLTISDWTQSVDIKDEKQFGAITIWLPKGEKYISFEGTDMTLLGWKESFNMSFMTNIPSQLEAVKYLEKIANKYSEDIRIGGHSKGGNLAVYSAIFCDENIKNRIIEILNADGPGFSEQIIFDEKYIKIADRIKTYIPQTSIIGILLEHNEDYNIIKSTQKGIMQHDIYSWQVNNTELIKINELTNESKMVNAIVKDWLYNTTPEQREKFINTLYEIVGKTDAKKITDFSTQWLKNLKKIIETYKTMKEDEKKQMEHMIKLTLSSIVSCMKNEVFRKK